MGRSRALGIFVVLALVLTAPPAGTHPRSSPSEWKPACGFDGNPILFSSCALATFAGEFHRSYTYRSFFHIEGHVNVTLFDGDGHTVWGSLGSYLAEPDYVDPPRGRGSGAPNDPFEVESSFAVGEPRGLVVRQFTEWVNGSNEVTIRWDVHNVTGEPVRFRLTALGDHWGYRCGYGELHDDGFGSYSPETGVPRFTPGCENEESDRGLAVHALKRGENPWSGFQQGDPVVVEGRVRDGMNLENVVEPSPGESALAAEWDAYGPGTAGLAPGATAHFSMGWRFSNDLMVTPWRTWTRKPKVRLKVETRWGLEGPQAGKRIGYQIKSPEVRRDVRGTVVTNERGVAYLVVRERYPDVVEDVRFFFDANGDGRWQEREELVRQWALVSFDDYDVATRFRARATISKSGGTFSGRVQAIKRRQAKALQGVDCRSERTVAIRRASPGEDVTLASATTDGDGLWDLTLDAGAGRYYGVVLPERRLSDDGFGYVCRGTRTS